MTCSPNVSNRLQHGNQLALIVQLFYIAIGPGGVSDGFPSHGADQRKAYPVVRAPTFANLALRLWIMSWI